MPTALVLGGVLTEHPTWRWCLLIAVPLCAIAVGGGAAVLPKVTNERRSTLVLLATVAVVAGHTIANLRGPGHC